MLHNIDNFSLGHTYFDSFLSKDQKDRVKNYRADINERDVVKKILNDHGIRKVFHLAAESHVDRSITGPHVLFRSNVMGTLSLVECCREHIEANKISNFRFLHVSTDEVFGDLGPNDEPFNEDTPTTQVLILFLANEVFFRLHRPILTEQINHHAFD